MASVAHHVRLADMNLDVLIADERRIEVIANGLPLWHGFPTRSRCHFGSPLHTGRSTPTPRARDGVDCSVRVLSRHAECKLTESRAARPRCRPASREPGFVPAMYSGACGRAKVFFHAAVGGGSPKAGPSSFVGWPCSPGIATRMNRALWI